jgi:hypothetical protein
MHGPFKRRQCGAVQAAPRPLRCEAADSNDGVHAGVLVGGGSRARRLRAFRLPVTGREPARREEMVVVSPSRQLLYAVQWNRSILVGSLLAACHAGPAPMRLGTPARGTTRLLVPPAAALLGRWEYAPPARLSPPLRPTLGIGLQVMLEFDSAAGGTAYGRVGRWFAGDVGIRASAFGPVTAELGDSGRVTITIPPARTEVAPITVVATRRGGDTLAISTARQGNDTGPLTAGPERCSCEPPLG